MTDKDLQFRAFDPSGTIRQATYDELQEAFSKRAERERLEILIEELRAELDQAQKDMHSLIVNCKHPVVVDEKGYPFSSRTCIACNEAGLIEDVQPI